MSLWLLGGELCMRMERKQGCVREVVAATQVGGRWPQSGEDGDTLDWSRMPGSSRCLSCAFPQLLVYFKGIILHLVKF